MSKKTTDKLGDAFSKFLEDNRAKIVDCTPVETSQQGWEKRFDKFLKPNGEFIGGNCPPKDIKSFICQLLQKEREELAGKIKGLSCCYTTPQKLEKRILQLLKNQVNS